METSKKDLIVLTLISHRNKLSQSENIKIDNRDTEEPIVDFVCALMQKKDQFSRCSFYHFGSTSNSTQLCFLKKMPKQKTEELGSLAKSEKVRPNRLYFRCRIAYGSVQSLNKASSLSDKKKNKSYKSRHLIQNLVHQSDVSDDFKFFKTYQ